MNAPEPIIPKFLQNTQPPAQFALWSDGHLLVRVGEQSLTLTPDDIRKLDRFMGTFGEGKD